MIKVEAFSNAVFFLPENIRAVLSSIEPGVKAKINEIRFRCDRPVTLNSLNEAFFVTKEGRLSLKLQTDSLICDARELQEIVFALSRRSMHTYQDMIAKGFIPLKGGCKAGIGGSAVMKNGEVYSVSRFNCVNIRVSRDYSGCAFDVLKHVGKSVSYLIVGTPLSGKTTVLRELCRYYSEENSAFPKKLAVIDERDEIASAAFGVGKNLGIRTDVLSLYPKAVGADIALRTLSPDIIMLDEIGADDESEVLLSSMRSGVGVIATAHGASFEEILKKPNIKMLLDAGVFKKVVVLNGRERPCTVKEAVSLE